MDKHLWEVDHSYYCTEGQYFTAQVNHQTIWAFSSWADFVGEMGDADFDYNMLFRWDWDEQDDDGNPTFNGDPYCRNGKLKLFFMVQRKGFHSCSIVDVCRADEPAVIQYLQPRLAHLISLWEPLAAPAADDALDLTLAQKYEDACIAANANARDAERYRSVRNCPTLVMSYGDISGGEDLDARVDAHRAAIAQQPQRKEA